MLLQSREELLRDPVADRGANEPFLTMQEISLALYSKNKIGAIKAVRNRSNLGLKEAKDLIDDLSKWATIYVDGNG